MARWRDLRVLLCFFTRIPEAWVGGSFDGTGKLVDSIVFVPLIGALIGACGGVILLVTFSLFPGDGIISVLLAISAMTLLTGALHEDGLSDMADSIGARSDMKRRIEIMHDSALGVYGVVALFLSLSLRIALILALVREAGVFSALLCLVAVHAWSRAAAFWLPYRLPPVPTMNLARSFGHPTFALLLQALLSAGLIVMMTVPFALGFSAASCAILAGLLTPVLLTGYCSRYYGHCYGDLIGSMQQLSELSFLLALVSFL